MGTPFNPKYILCSYMDPLREVYWDNGESSGKEHGNGNEYY